MARLFLVFRTVMWLGVALMLVWFAANNANPVELRFRPLSLILEVPPYLILFAGIFIGLGAATIATSWKRLRGFVERRQLSRERKQLTGEVATLSEEAHARAAKDAHNTLSNASVTGISSERGV